MVALLLLRRWVDAFPLGDAPGEINAWLLVSVAVCLLLVVVVALSLLYFFFFYVAILCQAPSVELPLAVSNDCSAVFWEGWAAAPTVSVGAREHTCGCRCACQARSVQVHVDHTGEKEWHSQQIIFTGMCLAGLTGLLLRSAGVACLVVGSCREMVFYSVFGNPSAVWRAGWHT